MSDQDKRDWFPERREGDFHLKSPFEPRGDQPAAIRSLNEGLSAGVSHQTLLGVTGSVAGVKFAQLAAKLSRHAEVRFICLWQHGGASLWAVLWPVVCGCLRFRSNGLPSGRSVALLPQRASPGMLCLRPRGSRCMRAVVVLVRCSPPPVWS